jgi:hypothetical protein
MSGEHLDLYTDLLMNEVAVRALLEGPWGETTVNNVLLVKHCPICQACVPWNSTDPSYSHDAAMDAHKDYHVAIARLLGRVLNNDN